MAVNPDDIDAIAVRLAELYRHAETSLIELIRGKLAAGTDGPTWADERLAAVAALRRSAESVVAGLTADDSVQLREAVASAYRTGRGAALTDLPEGWYPRSGIGQAARAALDVAPQAAAMEALAGALVRDVGARTGNVVRDVVDIYRSVIASATTGILTGNQTRRDAAQRAWQGFINRGVMSFTDRGGRRWQLSSYVEMATRTVAQRAAVQAQTDRLASLGVDLVYVSNAPQECKLCRPYEGKVLRTDAGPTGQLTLASAVGGDPVVVDVYDTLAGARANGLFHPNCRHSVSAYLPGATRLPKGPTEDPAGDLARQQQRAIERKIRRAKDQEVGALTDDARRAARSKVRAAQAQLRDHLAAHPELKRLRYREQRGAGNIPPGGRGPAGGAVRQSTQPTLDGGPGSVDLPPPRQAVNTAADDVDAARVEVEGQQPLDFDAAASRATQQAAEKRARQLADEHGDVVDGVDLRTATDDELYDLVARLDPSTPAGEAAFARAWKELGDREERAAQTPVVRAEPEVDDWLASKPGDESWDWDDPVDLTPEQQRIDDLLSRGWSYTDAYAEVHGLDPDLLRRQEAASSLSRRPGETVEQALRRAYDEWVHVQYLEAEQATRGYMLSREGTAGGIDPRSLFSGTTARARKYASEELQRYWADQPRLTYTQFKAQVLRREQDRQAAERTRLQGSDRDFL